jgi:anaerobic selenocysteine-containing dehydrogenase
MDHGGCTLFVEVEDGRIAGISPDPDGPLSHGYICPKGRALADLHNHPSRLRKPLRRTGERGSGRWEEISWAEAMAFAAQGFNKVKETHGARAVAFCQGAPKGLEHFVLIRLANTFGSPNVVGPQNVCHMPREIAGMLTCGFFPAADYANPTGAVVVWGSNLTATNEEGVIRTRLLDRLKQDSPRLVVIDPRRTELARRADVWLPVRPGTDAALALGFLNVIIEEGLYDLEFVENYTHGFEDLRRRVQDFPPKKAAALAGVDPEKLMKAARIYGTARPGMIQWGNGIEQSGGNFDACRALVCLMAVTGNLDAPGGNYAPLPPPVVRLGDFVRADLLPGRAKDSISAPYGPAPGFVTVAPEYFKRAVLTGEPYPVRAAYVHVSNPVLAWADSRETDRALRSLDFLAVAETFMSPTAALADLVLPAATELEFDDLGHFGLAHGYILARPKAVEPPGEARPNAAIINELAHALGIGDSWWDDYEAMLADILAPAGIAYTELAEKGILRGPARYLKYKDKGFKTPTGKVELALSKTDKSGLDPLPGYAEKQGAADPDFPLVLGGHKSPYFFCSDHRYLESLRKREPEPSVWLHPETAAEAGVTDGSKVSVETKNGAIVLTAKVTDDVVPGVLSVVHGWWLPELGAENPLSWSGTSLNVLTSSRILNKPFGTPDLRGLPARIEPVNLS